MFNIAGPFAGTMVLPHISAAPHSQVEPCDRFQPKPMALSGNDTCPLAKQQKGHTLLIRVSK